MHALIDLQTLAEAGLRGLTDSASCIVGVASFTVSGKNVTYDHVSLNNSMTPDGKKHFFYLI